MRTRFLSFILLTTIALVPGCGKDDAKSSPSNPNPAGAGTPTNVGGGNNNNCYCDECGCYILYSDGSYMDVDSCGAQPQQAAPQQQYPQQNYYPQNYGNNQQGFFPRLRNWLNSAPQQQGYGYPQQNYGYPQQQGYGYPQQQGYGYPQQNYYPR